MVSFQLTFIKTFFDDLEKGKGDKNHKVIYRRIKPTTAYIYIIQILLKKKKKRKKNKNKGKARLHGVYTRAAPRNQHLKLTAS